MSSVCYICSQAASSKEHTPARCFFPDDPTYRKNLVTVPSCKTHNEDTSKDDEYVRNIITMSMENNAVAYKQFIEKTVKSLKESPGLLAITTAAKKKVTVNGQPSTAFEIDRIRFDKVIKKMSYALFFNQYKMPWNRKLIIMARNLYDKDMQVDEFGALVAAYEQCFPLDNFLGNNPKVFKYSFLPGSSLDPNDSILRLIFYEGFTVWVSVVDGSAGPDLN
jgi:hypothetical protein